MSTRALSGMIDPAMRLVVTLLVPVISWWWWHAPVPLLVGMSQMTLYLSFLVVPPNLRKLLLTERISEKLTSLNSASYELQLAAAQPSGNKITVRVSDFAGSIVDCAAKAWFVDKLSTGRIRKIQESLVSHLVPVLFFVIFTTIFNFALMDAAAANPQHGASHVLTSVESFAQALIGLVPLLWIFGGLFGEIKCHRDAVFSAID